MEVAIIIGLIVFGIIYLLAQSSSKESNKEKYGEAIGKLAQMTADSVTSAAYVLTEPASKKKNRQAMELIAARNGRIYRYDWFSNEEYLKHLFEIDDKLKSALDELGLSEERWVRIAQELLYIGLIRRESRDYMDYSKKNTPSLREHTLVAWGEMEGVNKIISDYLKKALSYFNIKEDEWIKYGDAVIEMYNLYDKNKDLQQYGIIQSIMPMKNNAHLL